MHVDDCEVAGNPEDLLAFKKALVKQFGEVKEQEWEFRHCGIDYMQTRDYKKLTHSQKQFVDAITGLSPEPFNFDAGYRIQMLVDLIKKSSMQEKWLAVEMD